MLRFFLAIAAVCGPAAASAEGWRHAPSGIAIAELPDGFHVAAESDGRRDESDVIVQLATMMRW